MQGLAAEIVFRHQLADLGLQPLDLGAMLGFTTAAVDLERVDPTAVVLVGPLAELGLREPVLAGGCRY